MGPKWVLLIPTQLSEGAGCHKLPSDIICKLNLIEE